MGVYERWTSKRNNIVSHKGMEKTVDLKEPSRNEVNLTIKKPEDLESEFDHCDATNSYPTSPFKDRNIVDLEI